MLDLTKIDYLYPGSVSEFKKIDVSFGKNYKDFGKGFYMAIDKKHAINIMESKYKKSIIRGCNNIGKHLYRIQLNCERIKDFNVKCFEEINIEWLDFILNCKLKGGIPHNYDLVVGPTADDDTITCLKAYYMGLYGNINSDRTKEILLDRLKANVLGFQVFIGRQNVIDELIEEIKEIRW